jgi:hypothetical protein
MTRLAAAAHASAAPRNASKIGNLAALRKFRATPLDLRVATMTRVFQLHSCG